MHKHERLPLALMMVISAEAWVMIIWMCYRLPAWLNWVYQAMFVGV